MSDSHYPAKDPGQSVDASRCWVSQLLYAEIKWKALFLFFFFSIKTLEDNKQSKLLFSCHVASFYISPDAPVIVASDSVHELHSGAHEIIKVKGQGTSLPPQVFRSSQTLFSRSMHLNQTCTEFQKILKIFNYWLFITHNAKRVVMKKFKSNYKIFLSHIFLLFVCFVGGCSEVPTDNSYCELDNNVFWGNKYHIAASDFRP